MMDTPPIQSDCAFYYLNLVFSDAYSYTGTVCSDGTEEESRTTTVEKRYGIRTIKHSLKYLDGRVKKNIYHNKVL